MSDGTSIEWTEASWNPIRARVGDRVGWHCEILTPGCEHCYAEAINHRLGTGDDYLSKSRRAKVFLDENMLTQPLRWKHPRRIFVCSMSDLFGEWVPDEMLDKIFAVMALCPQHTFQVLTKRHERMRGYLNDMSLARCDGRGEVVAKLAPEMPLELLRWPLPNVWAGVSVEDQRRAAERIPVLLDTPAAVRWVSAEPLLERVSLRWLPGPYRARQSRGESVGEYDEAKRLDWIVVGGESGPGSRPFNIEWARSIIAQCKAAGVACFVKQLGAHPVERCREGTVLVNAVADMKLRDRKGGDPSEWPEDLRVREYPR